VHCSVLLLQLAIPSICGTHFFSVQVKFVVTGVGGPGAGVGAVGLGGGVGTGARVGVQLCPSYLQSSVPVASYSHWLSLQVYFVMGSAAVDVGARVSPGICPVVLPAAGTLPAIVLLNQHLPAMPVSPG
jgi:hypothetical protein